MKIFLSYASEHRAVAEQIYLSLIASGHNVFFDRESLPVGNSYHNLIRTAIKDCDVFIFLITHNSIEEGSYTLTELKFAREKWTDPQYNVLPVLIEKVSYRTIPGYLQAVTILQPEGNVAAEVAALIETWTEKKNLVQANSQKPYTKVDKTSAERHDSIFSNTLRHIASFLLGGLSVFLIVNAMMLFGTIGPEGDVLLIFFFGVLAASLAFVLWPRRWRQ